MKEQMQRIVEAAGDKCPSCGLSEKDAFTPRTVYECGSSDYDQRPLTFIQSVECELRQKNEHSRPWIRLFRR